VTKRIRGQEGAGTCVRGRGTLEEMVSIETLLGLHHVTALAGDPRRNLDFYSRMPGMRLVKRTVNFDDPAGYHFYFASGKGTPGALLTFFPWVHGRKGIPGSGQIAGVTMRTSAGALAKPLPDPDGVPIEWVEGAEPPGIQSVTLCQADAGPTVAFLRESLGLRPVGPHCLELPDGARIQVVESPGAARGKMAAGIVHHVALRVADEDRQLAWRQALIRAGLRVTAVRDRHYFHSIYFREPGGVLLEIATDGPGFEIDEAADRLGERLCLPPWLEPMRESIERRLPSLVERADG
jgi:glyoxalase family protein